MMSTSTEEMELQANTFRTTWIKIKPMITQMQTTKTCP
jgi:hypothetical protein